MLDKWDKRYLDMAKLVSNWSKDPAKQVGCILVDELNQVISTGFNGFPRGIDNWPSVDKLALTIHAEENALLQALRKPYTCYIWPYLPCSKCMAILAQAGIKRIVAKRFPSEKWRWDITATICENLNIEVLLNVD